MDYGFLQQHRSLCFSSDYLFVQYRNQFVKTVVMPPVKSKQGVGYSQMEIDWLLDLLEKHLPIASMEWERIENLHMCNFHAKDQTHESLKQ